MEEKIRLSETRQCKVVFPGTLNANETLFGGLAMQWMDEVAYIAATRFTRQRMFTINTENIKFMKPLYAGSIAEVVARVEKAGAVKLHVRVQVFVEEMYGQRRELAMESVFVFAALDENNRPRRILYNVNTTSELPVNEA